MKQLVLKVAKMTVEEAFKLQRQHKKKLTIYQQEQQEKDFEKLEKSVSINQGITLIKFYQLF